jgi:hypothetical protein
VFRNYADKQEKHNLDAKAFVNAVNEIPIFK